MDTRADDAAVERLEMDGAMDMAAGADASGDAAVDSGADAATDSAGDAARDVGADTPRDAGTDSAADASRDTGADAAPDAARDGDAEAGGACTPCTDYGTPERAGQITVASLNTLSGIGVSRRNPGVLYVHKDMTQPAFFAVTEAGALLGTYTLSGATVVDLEDMAVARCPAGTCVYLADIGGNLGARADFAVLRAPEPAISPTQAAVTANVTFERLTFTYPDGQHNAESLLVDPNTDVLYLVTKVAAGQASAVYRLPAAFGATGVAQKVADLTVPRAGDQPATSSSAHPCGAGFVLRTNNTLYEFRIAVGAPFEDAFRATPVTVPVATEPQGEAVAYRADGRGYFTTGEGAMPAINAVRCR
jgi:hypothetical protein